MFEGALEERLGFYQAASILVEKGETVEPSGEIGMIGAKGLLANGDSPLIEWLGLGVAADFLVEHREAVE